MKMIQKLGPGPKTYVLGQANSKCLVFNKHHLVVMQQKLKASWCLQQTYKYRGKHLEKVCVSNKILKTVGCIALANI